MRLRHLIPLCAGACAPPAPPTPPTEGPSPAGVPSPDADRTAAPGEAPHGMIAVPGAEILLGRAQPLAPFPPPPEVPQGAAPGGPIHRSAPEPLEPRRVRVGPFLIDRTEVTRSAYQAFLLDTGYRTPRVDEPWADDGWNWDGTDFPAGTGDHPVVLVSWFDAREYCRWAGERLPTEAEWQLAVLGPADAETAYPWGDTYDGAKLNHGRQAEPNFDASDGWEYTSPVGAFPAGASRYGLLDGFGNAWEWTADLRVVSWDEVLGAREGDLIVSPHTGTLGEYVAVRGGSYFFDLSFHPGGERNAFLPELRRKTSGFRCARDP